MNTKLLLGAIGNTDGDYIELANQWAKVWVSKDHQGWVVSGDIKETRRRAKQFPTLSEAMTYAVESLKSYRDGSPNK